MNTGEFGKTKLKFDQKSCVVCLEQFRKGEVVHITNECDHAYHYDCLSEWFNNLSSERSLPCPQCNTIITHTSKRPELADLSLEFENGNNSIPSY